MVTAALPRPLAAAAAPSPRHAPQKHRGVTTARPGAAASIGTPFERELALHRGLHAARAFAALASPTPRPSPRPSPRLVPPLDAVRTASSHGRRSWSRAGGRLPVGEYVLSTWKDGLRLFAGGQREESAFATSLAEMLRAGDAAAAAYGAHDEPSVVRQRVEAATRPAAPHAPPADGRPPPPPQGQLFMPGSCTAAGIASGRLVQQFFLRYGLSDEQIVGQLRKIEWFHSMSLRELHELNARSHHKFSPRYTTIFREGSLGDSFYVLLQGLVRCTSVATGIDEERGVGAVFDEAALVTKVRRSVTVVALEHCYLLQLDTQQAQSMKFDLLQFPVRAARHYVVEKSLERVPFFKALPSAQRDELSGFMDVRYFQPGEVIFKERDEGDKFYVVVEGTVHIFTVGIRLGWVVAMEVKPVLEEDWFRGVFVCTCLGCPSSTCQKDASGSRKLAGTCTATTGRAWLGEIALSSDMKTWVNKPRTYDAVAHDDVWVAFVAAHLLCSFADVLPTPTMLHLSSAPFAAFKEHRAAKEEPNKGDMGYRLTTCSGVSSRVDCGYVGVDQSACESRGCCWQPSPSSSAPWCFYSSSPPSPSPSPLASHGAIVQLFQWRWTDVAAECCDFLGPNGFDAVQVSPPMEQISAPQWWASYQPVSYELKNRLGDEAAFLAMVKSCARCGVKVVADAVTNHMAAGQGQGSAGSSFSSRVFPGTYGAVDFHHNEGDTSHNCAISNYQDRWNVQHCDLVGLPDLDSGADWPRRRLGAYLAKLVSLGVRGLRVDAAKHQDAGELGAILRQGNTSTIEVYQEVIGAPGEAVQPSEYTGNGRVTELGYSYSLSDTVRSGALANLRTLGDGLLPSQSALAFIDNHDSQRASAALAASSVEAADPHAPFWRGMSHATASLASGVLTYKEGPSYAVAAAFMLAWPYGRVRLMSSYYFDDHDAGPPSQAVHDGKGGVACGEGQPWVCEHRWSAIGGMVRWRLVAGDAPVGNWVAQGSNRIAFSRGARAFIALAAPGSGTWSTTLQTGLPAGEYCDVAADMQCKARVSVGSDGTASISLGASGVYVSALHINATSAPIAKMLKAK
ncbi:hypothetical protein AB1Y20_010668 [Prymnesium parvum]|uniref:alpha-amylase n=1 Tax=Prymnesium parvum TaxID=97485 RepID=A0AB34IRF1_PRYPA